jgi:hypothetical protein
MMKKIHIPGKVVAWIYGRFSNRCQSRFAAVAGLRVKISGRTWYDAGL